MTRTSWRDLRHAARALVARPLFSAAVVATLALGIGANAAIFSLIRATLLRPLPYRDADQLVQISALRGGKPGELSQREMRDMLEQLPIFQDIAAYTPGAAYNMSGDGPPEEVSATICTANLMETLGVPLLVGQFWPEDYDRQRNFGVVLNHGFWQRRFDGDPDIVGSKISLDSAATYTVFGILPPGVQFPSNVDLFRPRPARGKGRPARRVGPTLAIATVLVHLTGTVGGYLRFALVEHERCPEHGELIHTDGQDPVEPRVSVGRTSVDTKPSVEPGNTRPQDTHDPCSVTAAVRQRASAVSADAGGKIEPPCELAAEPAADRPFLASRVGYRVAPKTSPPAST
jgi:MacB-like periplasmic core domain